MDQDRGGAISRGRQPHMHSQLYISTDASQCTCQQQLSRHRTGQDGPLLQSSLCVDSVFKQEQNISQDSLLGLEKFMPAELGFNQSPSVDPMLEKPVGQPRWGQQLAACHTPQAASALTPTQQQVQDVLDCQSWAQAERKKHPLYREKQNFAKVIQHNHPPDQFMTKQTPIPSEPKQVPTKAYPSSQALLNPHGQQTRK